MQLTIEVPDALRGRIQQLEKHFPEVLERVISELLASQDLHPDPAAAVQDAEEVLDILADYPSPDRVLSLRPSATLQHRVEELLDRKKSGGTTSDEDIEIERYLMLEHLVRVAKTRALKRLASAQ
jgi:hypothetical protein